MKNYNKKETVEFATFYYLDDKFHRTDGPAIQYKNGHKEWWIDGKRHRIDGPAIEEDGYKAWYINSDLIGVSIRGFNQEKFEKYKKLLLLK